jgi:CheY-like chemotaxis protein
MWKGEEWLAPSHCGALNRSPRNWFPEFACQEQETIERFRPLTHDTDPREIDPMGQSKPLRATALIVEDDPMQREMICLLLEESDYDVIQCESAEAAQFVLERNGGSLWLMITDVKLAGQMDGIELAHIAKEHVPDLEVIVTSGKPLRQALPEGAKLWSKPWVPLDVIREAERMSVAHRTDDDA